MYITSNLIHIIKFRQNFQEFLIIAYRFFRVFSKRFFMVSSLLYFRTVYSKNIQNFSHFPGYYASKRGLFS